jgi:uncharacterized protein
MDQAIQDFIEGKRIAVVGASRSGKKFGNSAMTELKQRGYQVLVVHPEAQEIDGERCYPNLAAVKGQADSVWICVPPEQAQTALKEAVEAGFDKIWLQQGAQSPEALALAHDLGVTPVAGKCILMYAQPVTGFHNWHRMFNRLIGQL